MKRTTLRWLAVALAVSTGCQSGPRFAWFKRDQATQDSSVVARSATPALPSAQSKPQPVAVAGLTPAAPPSSTNLAASAPPAAGATGVLGAAMVASPNAPSSATSPPTTVPVPPTGAVAAAPQATYPSGDTLADKLVMKSNSTATSPYARSVPPAAATTATPTGTQAIPTTVAAIGPYDPSAYKPSESPASIPDGTSPNAGDRYAITPVGPVSSAATANGALPLASVTAERYGSPITSTTTPPSPGAAPVTNPAALADDRYANPPIPTLPASSVPIASATSVNPPVAAPATPTATAAVPAQITNPTSQATSPVSLAFAPGQYRPGRTSSYITASATLPVEIASRPAPPAASAAAPATGAASQPWSPPVVAPQVPATRTY